MKKFELEQLVILYQSRLRLMPGKLLSQWIGPFRVQYAWPSGVVLLQDLSSDEIFTVNGHRLKIYCVAAMVKEVDEQGLRLIL